MTVWGMCAFVEHPRYFGDDLIASLQHACSGRECHTPLGVRPSPDAQYARVTTQTIRLCAHHAATYGP